ncbi:MAG: radical SAM protein [Candidatus Omnitrophota bacterium]
MKAVLINPSWTQSLGRFAELARQRTYSPPLGICYVAAVAEQRGHQVQIIDAEAERLIDPLAIVERLNQIDPDIIGITATSPVFPRALLLAGVLKDHFTVPLVIGGSHINVSGQAAFADCFDYAVYGDGEYAFSELMQTLEGNGELAQVPGLIFRRGGMVQVNPQYPTLENVDELPFPAIHLLKNELYSLRFASRKPQRYTSIMAMRGCPFKCVFCSEPLTSKGLRMRSAINIVDEIERDFRELGIEHFTFVDSNITLSRKQAIDLSREIKKRNIAITWEGWTRANLVDEEMLREMKASGFVRISFGIESGDPRILKIIKKEVALEDMRRAFKLARKLKIEALCSAMIGLPGETRESIDKTISFIRNTPEIEYSNLSIAVPYPGTEMYEMARRQEHGLKLLSEDLTRFNRYDGAVISVNDLLPQDLVRLQKIGLLKIHFTPARIVKSIKLVKFNTLLVLGFSFLGALLGSARFSRKDKK